MLGMYGADLMDLTMKPSPKRKKAPARPTPLPLYLEFKELDAWLEAHEGDTEQIWA